MFVSPNSGDHRWWSSDARASVQGHNTVPPPAKLDLALGICGAKPQDFAFPASLDAGYFPVQHRGRTFSAARISFGKERIER